MQHRQAVLLRRMISARHYSSCGGILRSPGFSPLPNLLPAIGTVQKLLSALAPIILKMDQLLLTRSLSKKPAAPSRITANCISGAAWSAKEGCHLGPLSPSLLISQPV